MRRREFITLLGGTAVAWPLAARSQQPAMPVIGFAWTDQTPDVAASRLAAFQQGLRQVGLVEGESLAVEWTVPTDMPSGRG
jgi:putative ABC transport system substrate-binding protein